MAPMNAEPLKAARAEQFENAKLDKLEHFKRLNQYVQPGQVLFVGSSLMEQFPIYEFLQDFDLPFKIYNRGVGGYTTAELLETMDVCVYDLKPAHVFINIGTNDMNGPDYSKDGLIQRYAKILEGIRMRLPRTTVTVLAYYPVNPVAAERNPLMKKALAYRTNARIQEANEAVCALAERLGAKYLDLNAPLRDEQGNLKDEYTVEGVHMYANGYKAVLDQLIPVLRELS